MPTNGIRSGTGGGLPYIEENPASDMVNQELSHSCQAACARQILLEAGVDIPEQAIRERIGYLEGYGTTASDTAQALTDLHPLSEYGGGAVDPGTLPVLCQRTPWIATFRTNFGSHHSVIVDKLEGDLVHLRDPWGKNGPGSAQEPAPPSR